MSVELVRESKAASPWELFDVEQLRAQLPESGVAFWEFLRVPSLHLALYRLPKGAKDMQSPHEEDEVYYVIEGRGRIRLGDGDSQDVRTVEPGMVLHVKAAESHSFFEIEEDMLLLVLFSVGGSTDLPTPRSLLTR